ncbi:hypothetical protein FQN57_005029 [Myotisia sp. PD_48]|nr:hypothetical protein FQN57_005029 [Myotisia sp. PD_48]
MENIQASELSQKLPPVRQPFVPQTVIFSSVFKDTRPPLVTDSEIRLAENLCPDKIGPSIYRISESRVLKFGRAVHLDEAEALCLLHRRAPSVPVPRVYNAYQLGDVSYIVMDYIHGQSLGDCWNGLSEGEKRSVIAQLRKHIKTWRAIKGEYYGSVGRGPCRDALFLHGYTHIGLYGPFKSRPEFNEGVVQALRDSRPNPSQYNLPLEREIRKTQGDEIIFTHGDLGPRNIMLKDGNITILDWGGATYSIKELEFVQMKWQASQNQDWEAHIAELVPNDLPNFTSQYRFWNRLVNDMRLFSGI